jgi:peptidyl-dipeptidase Dcp
MVTARSKALSWCRRCAITKFMNNENSLLKVSTLPWGALPFSEFQKSNYLPALRTAIEQAKADLDEIRYSPEPVTFANTILALETSGENVSRVASVFFNLLGADGDVEMQAISREMSPLLADFSSTVHLDEKLFIRVKAVWDARALHGLSGEDSRLTEKTYREFVRNGALLSEEKKSRLRAIDSELAVLSPQFSENVLAATNEFEMLLREPSEVAGLPESALAAAQAAAQEKGHPVGTWLITLQAPSSIPFMTYADRRDLRERLHKASGSRAFGGAHDNSAIVLKTVQLRHERAQIMGYANHAQFVLEERMAETPERVQTFLHRLTEKTMPAARREINELKEFKRTQLANHSSADQTHSGSRDHADDFQPWDVAYWSEKLKLKLHQFDEEELRPYFKLENVANGVFEHARRLYGLQFKKVTSLPVYHPDVQTFEVVDETSGKFVGLFYADFFPRQTKQSGAWATTFLEQGLRKSGEVLRPHVSIVCNFTKPVGDQPSLLSLDEVLTLFHEFGHALHSLLSDCRYVSLAGTNVFWDFVELPSQIMENWVLEKEALDLFAVHYQTKEPIPRELTEKIKAAARFHAGIASVRQMIFATLDLAWHSVDPSEIRDVDAFEKQTISPLALLPPVAGTNMSVSFSHIFAGGYSAGYYSYKWAEVLDADAFEFFKERGLFNREVAQRFRDSILSRGGTEPPMELYKRFRGREPDPDALLRRDGLLK